MTHLRTILRTLRHPYVWVVETIGQVQLWCWFCRQWSRTEEWGNVAQGGRQRCPHCGTGYGWGR